MKKNSFLTALLVCVAMLGAKAQNKNMYKADTIVDAKGNIIVNVYSAQTVTIRDFEMSVAGAGKLVCNDLHADRVDLNVAGVGDLVCKNLHADHANLSVAGSGNINIESGMVKSADISVAGTGSVETRCELESMDYNISGCGSIYYYGNVKVKGTNMGGRIKRIDGEK